MEHTPGPWEVQHKTFDPPNDWYLYIDAGTLNIALIDVQNTSRPMSSYLADARLIAAAPEYDDLLKRFTTYIQTQLLANIRTIEGGQAVIDGAWDLVAESHGLRKRIQATGA